MTSKRVVITGMGVVSPIGCDLETLWNSLCEGKSGIKPINSLPMQSMPVSCGAEAQDFTGKIEDYGDLDKKLQRAIKKNMKVMCREIEMGVAAAQKALLHSGLGDDRDPERCGCLFGCDYILTRPEEYSDGVNNCRNISGGEFNTDDWPTHGISKVNPLWLLKYLPNMPNSHVSIYNDFRGPNNAITVREASMDLSVSEAASIIERGAADAMLVGATGSRIHPLRTAHVSLVERIASDREDPTQMARPFDSSCDGMVLGEGAGALMLESYEHATSRGATIYGEVIGAGASMVGPSSDGRDFLQQAVYQALNATIKSAGDRLPSQWHVHAQGLSTPEIDLSEAAAISRLVEEKPGATGVTTAKSYFGNLGAGSAAVELISSLIALQKGKLFPIRNLTKPNEMVSWQPATLDTPAGSAFVHTSFSAQGQAACLAIAAA